MNLLCLFIGHNWYQVGQWQDGPEVALRRVCQRCGKEEVML